MAHWNGDQVMCFPVRREGVPRLRDGILSLSTSCESSTLLFPFRAPRDVLSLPLLSLSPVNFLLCHEMIAKHNLPLGLWGMWGVLPCVFLAGVWFNSTSGRSRYFVFRFNLLVAEEIVAVCGMSIDIPLCLVN